MSISIAFIWPLFHQIFTAVYGHNRNTSELAMFRYQKILGDSLYSREFSRQKQEAMIGCGVLNL